MEPSDAHWYLATLVYKFDLGEPTSTVHLNSHLIRAASPEEALEKALRLGEPDFDYGTLSGRRGRSLFRGLYQLLRLPDQFEDGCELFWKEVAEASDADIENMIQKPEQMAAFAKPPRYHSEYPGLPIYEDE